MQAMAALAGSPDFRLKTRGERRGYLVAIINSIINEFIFNATKVIFIP
jgi:hypothetical protein